jgi:hypothetical protein
MLFELSNGMINALDWAIRAALLVAIAAVWFRYRKARDPFLRFSAWATAFALTPVLFPTSQRHYLVFLLPAYVYTVYAWYCLGKRDKWIAGLTLASFGITSLTNRMFVGSFSAAVFLAAGSFVWGSLLAALSVLRAASVHACGKSNTAESI